MSPWETLVFALVLPASIAVIAGILVIGLQSWLGWRRSGPDGRDLDRKP